MSTAQLAVGQGESNTGKQQRQAYGLALLAIRLRSTELTPGRAR